MPSLNSAQPRILKCLRQLHSPILSSLEAINRRLIINDSFWLNLDRVNVLEGHTGCVNALSWSADGQILLSSGDDRTIRLWRLDDSDLDKAFPLTTRATIRSGHTANIFNTQFLSPSSHLVASCAGDDEVRIFDLERAAGGDPTFRQSSYSGIWDDTPTSTACIRVFNCHRGRVKRIITEDTTNHFLSVAEDGSVRQHDLRSPHRCDIRQRECPPPLVKVPFELSTMSMSNLTPYYFVVAGESPHAYLYDRRHCRRTLSHQWGMHVERDDVTACVRKLGRQQRGRSEQGNQEHITGSRMSNTIAHEVLLSYSADAVYLYNTQDDTVSPQSSGRHDPSLSPVNCEEEVDCETDSEYAGGAGLRNNDDDMLAQLSDGAESDYSGYINTGDPFILPRMRYSGACNVETVKDVNFLGRSEEYVTSGSDDGNWFIWSKKTGAIMNVMEGDGSVVNVVEQNPQFACCAVSGIDHSVKIFARGSSPSPLSRLNAVEEIVNANCDQSQRLLSQRARLFSLLAQYRLARGEEDSDDGSACVQQ